MPSIGPLEIGILMLILLLLFGAKRLPELGRSMGHGIREFRSSIDGRTDEPLKEEGAQSSRDDVEHS